MKKRETLSSSDKVSQLIFTEKMFYVLGELMLSDMLRSKCSYQRIAYRSHLYILHRKKGMSYMTSTKERLSVPTDNVIIPHKFRFVSAFFEKLKNFYQHYAEIILLLLQILEHYDIIDMLHYTHYNGLIVFFCLIVARSIAFW